MGGIMFIIGIFIAVVAAGGRTLAGDFTALIVYVFALVFGIIGFIDDFFKVRFHKPTRASPPPRNFLLQLAAAIAFVVLLRFTGHITQRSLHSLCQRHPMCPGCSIWCWPPSSLWAASTPST